MNCVKSHGTGSSRSKDKEEEELSPGESNVKKSERRIGKVMEMESRYMVVRG